MSVDVSIRKGEPVDKALRRLRKIIDREDIIKATRDRRYFVKPCQVKRQKKKEQVFMNMLRNRYESL